MRSNILILILLLCTYFAFTQIDRSVEPKPTTDFKMHLPNIQRAELDNGLKILVVEHRELPIVQFTLVIRSGADADPTGKFGTASLTADLLDEGTKTRDALKIADELDFVGSELSVYANYDASIGSLLTLKEYLDKSVELIADVFLNPVFPEKEFKRLKSELLTDLTAQKARPDIIANNIFNKMLFGETHPYGSDYDGSEETIKKINLTDIKEYYNNNYLPNNSSIIIVGDISKEEAVFIVKKYFSKWKKGKLKKQNVKVVNNTERVKIYLVDKENAPQSQIRIGNIGIARNNPDFYAVNILNQIIGASNGRLYLNLREAKGYTYGAYANFSMRKAPGPFIAAASVKTEVTDSSLLEFLYEFERIRNEFVDGEEFEMYRTAVIQRLPRVLETPSQIASQLMAIELFNLPDDYFNTLIERYKQITPEDIKRVANKYIHPDKLTVVIVGDIKEINKQIENLNLGVIQFCNEKGEIIDKGVK